LLVRLRANFDRVFDVIADVDEIERLAVLCALY
jgi:hypothetical protein